MRKNINIDTYLAYMQVESDMGQTIAAYDFYMICFGNSEEEAMLDYKKKVGEVYGVDINPKGKSGSWADYYTISCHKMPREINGTYPQRLEIIATK